MERMTIERGNTFHQLVLQSSQRIEHLRNQSPQLKRIGDLLKRLPTFRETVTEIQHSGSSSRREFRKRVHASLFFGKGSLEELNARQKKDWTMSVYRTINYLVSIGMKDDTLHWAREFRSLPRYEIRMDNLILVSIRDGKLVAARMIIDILPESFAKVQYVKDLMCAMVKNKQYQVAWDYMNQTYRSFSLEIRRKLFCTVQGAYTRLQKAYIQEGALDFAEKCAFVKIPSDPAHVNYTKCYQRSRIEDLAGAYSQADDDENANRILSHLK
ncbi:MAG: hypothetical protein SP4CHLAM5_05470 [Chlamydiia bacterium]|nr:hypothetical protein [Chlamydiia bacterium]MCH9618417.1 hypothetical protein [Chlamydiia bacterium]MCH9623743.1 hypothetical protein [Chlamydiia bacterium]